jgi:hypothetical protein
MVRVLSPALPSRARNNGGGYANPAPTTASATAHPLDRVGMEYSNINPDRTMRERDGRFGEMSPDAMRDQW